MPIIGSVTLVGLARLNVMRSAGRSQRRLASVMLICTESGMHAIFLAAALSLTADGAANALECLPNRVAIVYS